MICSLVHTLELSVSNSNLLNWYRLAPYFVVYYNQIVIPLVLTQNVGFTSGSDIFVLPLSMLCFKKIRLQYSCFFCFFFKFKTPFNISVNVNKSYEKAITNNAFVWSLNTFDLSVAQKTDPENILILLFLANISDRSKCM